MYKHFIIYFTYKECINFCATLYLQNSQYLSHTALGSRHTCEVPYDADADTLLVITTSMGTN
jgi:hypothetical protein